MSLHQKLADSSGELAELYQQKADLMKQLARANRMRAVWPDCFGKLGQVERYTTQLGGTGTVPFTVRFWLERCEDKVKMEITQEQ